MNGDEETEKDKKLEAKRSKIEKEKKEKLIAEHRKREEDEKRNTENKNITERLKGSSIEEFGLKSKETKQQKPFALVSRIGASARIKGLVKIIGDDGNETVLKPGMPINLNDHVITGPNSSLQVFLLDETVFTLGPETDMVFDEFVYDPHTSIGSFTASILKGAFRFISGKINHRDTASMKIKLPSGTIGIRGTELAIQIKPDGSGKVNLYKGRLEITELKSHRIFWLHANETVSFSKEGNFSTPLKLTSKKIYSK